MRMYVTSDHTLFDVMQLLCLSENRNECLLPILTSVEENEMELTNAIDLNSKLPPLGYRLEFSCLRSLRTGTGSLFQRAPVCTSDGSSCHKEAI